MPVAIGIVKEVVWFDEPLAKERRNVVVGFRETG
jgi:hypothetical protein